MWSDRYVYYNIQSDTNIRKKADIKVVCDVLLKTNCFIQKNHQTFSNANHFPWVDITLAETQDGNFSTSDKEINLVSLIAIVCSKGEDSDQSIYQNVFSEIAKQLNWKLYLESDEDKYVEI